ncbi:MAG: redoxin domain-containing protein [Planctomycetes bacterium]|nr:redoxin domain-containing protein [Planctomycetota bacterium]MCB9916775.1 redoxin domain-containing protein [Planctomycetota bacterium]
MTSMTLLAALACVPLTAILLMFDASSSQDDKPSPKSNRPRIAVGDVAPAFRLNDHEGKLVSVGGKTDKWTVLAFYPKALTGG